MYRKKYVKGLLLLVLILFMDIAFSYSNLTGPEGKATLKSAPENKNFIRPRRITNEQSSLLEFEPLDIQIQNFMNRWDIVGASVAVVRKGKLVYTKGFGYANEEQLELVQPEHKFRIASVSKLITAVAIMKLQEQGFLSINDHVFGPDGILNDSIYLNYRDRKVEDITVRHLLEHSGGWSTRSGDPLFMTLEIANRMNVPAPASPEVIIQYVLERHRLYFAPGTRSYYSNFGYSILGEVIEKASGLSYEDFVLQEIMLPLGIFDTQIGHNLLEQRHKGEVCYYDKENAPYRLSCDGSGEMVPRPYGGTNVEALGAAGGWISSTPDLMRLMVAIDAYPDKPDFLSIESIETMTCPSQQYLHPLGWRGTNQEGRWWRTGTLAGTSALMVRQNDEISWVMLLNTSTWKGSRFSREINRAMTRAINSVKIWPERDLFEQKYPPNINPIPPSGWATKSFTSIK